VGEALGASVAGGSVATEGGWLAADPGVGLEGTAVGRREQATNAHRDKAVILKLANGFEDMAASMSRGRRMP
jgi:hypothetical protein